LEVQADTGWRKASVSLLPSQYQNAVRWHGRKQKVRIDALFEFRTRPWRVLELFDFESLDKNQGEFFLEEMPPALPNDEAPPRLRADEGDSTR
jgi:hypothetical protein